MNNINLDLLQAKTLMITNPIQWTLFEIESSIHDERNITICLKVWYHIGTLDLNEFCVSLIFRITRWIFSYEDSSMFLSRI